MRVHRVHPLRRHDDPMPKKVLRSAIFLASALLFALALTGFLRDAEAQTGGWQGFSLRDGAGGEDYYSWGNRGSGADAQMMQLGINALWMGHQADMQRRQHAYELRHYPRPKARARSPRLLHDLQTQHEYSFRY